MAKPLILVPTKSEVNHWLLHRTVEKALGKAGMNDVVVRYLFNDDEGATEPPMSRPEIDDLVRKMGTKCVVVMGEAGLSLGIGETDIERWWGRQVPHSTWGTMIPLHSPKQMLPFRVSEDVELDDDDVIGSYLKPRGIVAPSRFQGWARILMRVAKRLANELLPKRPPRQYLVDLSAYTMREWALEALKWLKGDPESVLSYDIETAYHLKKKGAEDTDEETIDYDRTIIRISFSYKPNHAVSIPFTAEHFESIRLLLESPYPKLGWNSWAFDQFILDWNGYPIEDAEGLSIHYDGQDAWHYLHSDMPKGLEFVTGLLTPIMPWKHLNDENPGLYSCIDADAALQSFYWTRSTLRAKGKWDGYMWHGVWQHEADYHAGRAGVRICEPYRQRLDAMYQRLLVRKLMNVQGRVTDADKRYKLYKPKGSTKPPAEPKPVKLKKDGTPFKERVSKAKPKAPKEVKPVEPRKRRENWVWQTTTIDHKRRVCLACKRPNVNRKHACKVDPEGWNKDYRQMLGEETVREVREYKAALTPAAFEVPGVMPLDMVKDWLKFNGFNPNSSDQLLKYMLRYRHPVGYNPKTESDSADTKHLKTLVKRFGDAHPVYRSVIDIHKLSKAHSTYVVGVAPDSKGLVYTTFVNAPTTWRKASRKINLQNQSKRGENKYAKRTRAMFISKFPSLKELRSIREGVRGWENDGGQHG